jgi:hypothetical protein
VTSCSSRTGAFCALDHPRAHLGYFIGCASVLSPTARRHRWDECRYELAAEELRASGAADHRSRHVGIARLLDSPRDMVMRLARSI